MKKYRVAQTGAGVRGRAHLNAFLKLSDRFQIVGLCDIDASKLKEVAGEKNIPVENLYSDTEKMLAETRPDIFCFVTQPDIRLPMIKLGVKYKVKSMAFEKPMALSLKEAEIINELCRENGIKSVVSHQHKYLTSLKKLKQLVDSGSIGKIYKIEASCQAGLSILGTHYMDCILWANHYSHAKWAVGHVHGKNLLSGIHPSPNYFMGQVEFENGVRAFFEFGRLASSYMENKGCIDNRLTVYGTNGYVWGDTDGRWGSFNKNSEGKVVQEQGPGWHEQESKSLQIQYLDELADWLDGNIDNHSCNLETAYHGYEILSAVCISALDHIRVDFPLNPDTCRDIFERMRNELPECPEIKKEKT